MAYTRGAGQLFERVAFEERVTAPDGHGNKQAGFTERLQCRAGFTYLRGGEGVMAGRLEGKQPIVVRIRLSSQSRAIRPDWRMRDVRSGEFYAVQSIQPTTDRAWLDVLVQSGIAE